MGDMVDFLSAAWEHLDNMNPAQLADLLERVMDRLAAMDETEPEDMNSEAYDTAGRTDTRSWRIWLTS